MAALSEMTHLFQVCDTPSETYEVVEEELRHLFPTVSGSLYLKDPSCDVLEKVAEWGEALQQDACVLAGDCWALRSGKPHEVGRDKSKVLCSHMNPVEDNWHLCLPLMAQGESLGTLHLCAPFDPAAGEDDQTVRDWTQFYSAVSENLALAITNLRLRETLRKQAFKDPLTELYNRRYLVDALEREFHRADRKKQPLSIIMMDIDHFKQCNDTFGHDAGDAVLAELGNLLRKWTRGEDVVSRYGGEEFIAVLPGADCDAAFRRADSLRKQVESLAIEYKGKSLGQVTISVGIAVYPLDATDSDALIHAADQAMYFSKRCGRNRVSLAADQESQVRSLVLLR